MYSVKDSESKVERKSPSHDSNQHRRKPGLIFGMFLGLLLVPIHCNWIIL